MTTQNPLPVEKQSSGSGAIKHPLVPEARRIMIAAMLGLMILTGTMTWLTLNRIKTIERRDLQNTLEI